MRKYGLIIAAATAFGLGIVAATSCAAVSLNFTEIKVDYSHTAKACVAGGGAVVDKNGQAFCRTPIVSPTQTSSGGSAGLKVEMHEVLVSSTPVKPGQTTPSNPR